MTSRRLTTKAAEIGDVYCFNKNCKGEKCVLLDAHVCILVSIYGCGKCWACSLVHQLHFSLQENVSTTKTDKTRFFNVKKSELLPGKQIITNVPTQSTKYSKEKMSNLYVDNEIQEIIGDLYCLTCKNEKCVYISINRACSFHECKKCETSSHVLNIPFKKQKSTMTFFGRDGTCCFAIKTSGDY